MNEHGNSPWRIGWESAKANRLPATVLWAVAAAMVLAYYNAPWFTSALEPLRRFQVNYGVVAAVVNQMFFCGLVPCAFMLTVKEIRTAGARGRQAVLLGGERRVCVAAEPHGRVQGRLLRAVGGCGAAAAQARRKGRPARVHVRAGRTAAFGKGGRTSPAIRASPSGTRSGPRIRCTPSSSRRRFRHSWNRCSPIIARSAIFR